MNVNNNPNNTNFSLAQSNLSTVQNQSFFSGNNNLNNPGIQLSEETKSQNAKLLDIYHNTSKQYFFQKALVIAGNLCYIAEIEYYQSPDSFIHGDVHQLTCNCFYFHRQNGKSYKGGTYKGLDITIGCPPDFFGGILIRSILTPQGFIEGPCKVVDYILSSNGFDTIEKLIMSLLVAAGQQGKQLQEPIPCDFDNPYLKVIPNIRQETPIYNGPRVGLNLKKEQQVMGLRCQYIMKAFRFTCYPSMIKNDRHMLVVQARFNNIPDETIVRDFNLQAGLLNKWVTNFIKGKSMMCEFFLTEENNKLDKVAVQLQALGFFLNIDGY